MVGVLADDVVDRPGFSLPVGIVPRPAHGRDVGEPWDLGGDPLELFQVTEFPGLAGALNDEQLVVAVERAFLPLFVQGASVTDEGRDAGDRAEKQVIRLPARRIQGKPALRDLARGDVSPGPSL